LPEASVRNLAQEVIRRLAHDVTTTPVSPPTDGVISLLCKALMSDDDQEGAAFVSALRSDGATLETVYLHYLAGAARMLGTWWEEDRVSFVEVTLATSRMYAIMRSLGRELPSHGLADRKAAVFATVPGEGHILGVKMAADLFRKDGWDIELKLGKTHDELVEEIGRSDVVIIGLSASSERSLEALSKLVIALRIKTPSTAIFVSGNVVANHADIIELMDVDGWATDYDEARAHFEARVAELARG
jgi:methanogenic corrinoid protein MtbC1